MTPVVEAVATGFFAGLAGGAGALAALLSAYYRGVRDGRSGDPQHGGPHR